MKFLKVLIVAVSLFTPSILMAQLPPGLEGSYVGTANLVDYFSATPTSQKSLIYVDLYANGTSNVTIIAGEETITGTGQAGVLGNNLFVKYTVQSLPMTGRLSISGNAGKIKLSGALPVIYNGFGGVIEVSKIKLKQGPFLMTN